MDVPVFRRELRVAAKQITVVSVNLTAAFVRRRSPDPAPGALSQRLEFLLSNSCLAIFARDKKKFENVHPQITLFERTQALVMEGATDSACQPPLRETFSRKMASVRENF